MNNPETFSLIDKEQLIEARAVLGGELLASTSGAEYLNNLLTLYSASPLTPRNNQERPGVSEPIFQGKQPASEAQGLVETSRFIMLDPSEKWSSDTDAFFRGTLLGTHYIKTAAEDSHPVYESLDFLRKRLIKSAPGLISEYDDEVGDVALKRLPAYDADPFDENADSDNLFVRQTRISKNIHDRLTAFDEAPVIPEQYESIAHELLENLPQARDESYKDMFLMGYRYMIKLYTEPDTLRDIDELVNDYFNGFAHIPDRSDERYILEHLEAQLGEEPIRESISLEEAGKKIFHQLKKIHAYHLKEGLTKTENYLETITDKLSIYIDSEYPEIAHGALVQVNGNYYAELEYMEAGEERLKEYVEWNPNVTILGTIEGFEIMTAPTEKSLRKFLETADMTQLVWDQIVPAVRITEPTVINPSNDSEGEPVALPASHSFLIPLGMEDADINLLTFETPTESTHDSDS